MCCFQFLNNSENPAHLRKMLNIRTSQYNIRSLSTETKKNECPFYKTQIIYFRIFCHIRTTVWKELSTNIRTISNFNILKCQLKSFFFSSNLIFLHRHLLCLYTLTLDLMFYTSIFFIELCINSANDCMLFVKLYGL